MKSNKEFKRDKFLFYDNYYKWVRNLPDKVRLEVYDAICHVSFFGCEPESMSSEAEDAFCLIRHGLYTSLKNYTNRMSTANKNKTVSKVVTRLDANQTFDETDNETHNQTDNQTFDETDNGLSPQMPDNSHEWCVPKSRSFEDGEEFPF